MYYINAKPLAIHRVMKPGIHYISLSHPGVWSPRRENGRGAGRGGLGFAAARGAGLGDLAAERVRMVQVGCGLPVTPSFLGYEPVLKPGAGTCDLRVALCCFEHAGQYSGR